MLHAVHVTKREICRIIQRAGVIPMSIAGIAKEVTQISVAAWLFGDELSPVNIIGVGITVCGESKLECDVDLLIDVE